MIRRKQYLYATNAIPRRTRYRQRLRERRLAALSEQVQNLSREDMEGTVELDDELSHEPKEQRNHHVSRNADGCTVERTDSGIADVPSNSGEYLDESLTSVDVERSCDAESTTEEPEELEMVSEDQDSDEGLHPEDVEFDISPSEIVDHDSYVHKPLYEGASATVGDVMLMCLALGLRHSLSWTAIVDILAMINNLFDSNVIKSTKHFFLKYMEAGKGKTIFHLYCPYCERYLGSKQEIIGKQIRACSCGTEIKEINKSSTYFLSLSFGDQIKDLLQDSKFVKGLNYRFTRKKMNDDAYEDIYDGEVYRALSRPGEVLYGKYNFSYCFNTDGFPVGGKSGKQSCWPIYIQFNELPPRMRSQYMLLAGIYVGPKDPNMKTFLYPFVEEANFLSSKGVDWTVNGKAINSKVIPLCACVDSPARAKLLNMTQFNGYYGCTLCHCKAESTGSGPRYTIPLNGLNERTHEEILVNAAQAHDNKRLIRNKKKRVVQGVKGLSPIHVMSHIDLVKGVRPDPLHSKLLGNVRHHTSFFYDTAGKLYYIGSDVRKNAISERLKSIKPPSSVLRSPRGIHHLCLWKGTEWRSWALFYGVVCMLGIVPDEFVVHFSMLSTSLHIIFQKSITPSDLDVAHSLILRYVFLCQEYFGKEFMVFNIHLLLHTKRDVECLGPAWTNIAFGFEGANRTLLQLKKGTSSIAQEIARKYLTFKALPFLSEKYASSDKSILFCEKLSGRALKSFHRIGETVLVGSGIVKTLDQEEYSSLQSFTVNPSSRQVLCHAKMLYKGVRYCTSSYSRSEKHDDSFICIHKQTRCRIEKICTSLEGNAEQLVLIFVRELILNEKPLFDDDYGKHNPIRRIEMEGRLLVIRPQDISTQCVAMFLDCGNFICDMPYGCYSES